MTTAAKPVPTLPAVLADSTGRALHKAIVAHPDEITPRVVPIGYSASVR